MAFHNHTTGYGFVVPAPRILALFFGVFFYIYHGIWTHVLIQVIAVFVSGGFSIIPFWLVYAVLAPTILKSHYEARGYTAYTKSQLMELDRQRG